MKHLWRNGFHNSKMDAEKAWDELESIRGGGTLKPEQVIKSGKRKGSAFHDYFVWDDSIAAGRYRRDQAAEIIRSIRVEVTEVDSGPPTVARVYINPLNDGTYHTVADVLSDETLRERAFIKALSELRAIRDKYTEYEELFGVLKKATDQLEIILAA